jgi:hypothetical protein
VPASLGAAPIVVSDGQGFLVTWIDGDRNQVMGVRVGADGSLLDPQPVVYATGDTGDGGPPFGPWFTGVAATFDGSSYVLAWQANYMDGCGIVTRWSSGGGDPAPVQWPSCPYGDLHLASDGKSTLVAWMGDEGLVGVRYASGKLLDPKARVLAPRSGLSAPMALAAGASGYLAVWADGQTASDEVLYAARVSSDAQALDPTPLVVAKGNLDLWSWGLAFDGTSYVVAWGQSLNGQAVGIRAAAIGTDGSMSSAFDLAPPPTGGQQPALATLGPGGSLVAYQRFDILEPYRSIRVRMRTLTGIPDGGVADAGLADSGADAALADATVPEAGGGGGHADAGAAPGDAPVSPFSGCGCIASGGPPAGAVATAGLAFAAAAMRRRTRRLTRSTPGS